MTSPSLHVSASSLNCLRACPREFAYRYLQGAEREDRSASLVLGSAVHKSLEAYYRALKDDVSLPTSDDLARIAAVAISKDLVDDVPICFADGESAEWLVEEAYRTIEAFLDSPYRPARVIDVELRFALSPVHPVTGEIIDEFEELVVGVFDLVCFDEQGNLQVVDHKVSKRFAPPKVTNMDLQAQLYCWAAETLFQRPVQFLHHVLVRTKKARTELVEIPRSAGDTAEAVEAVWAGIEEIHHAVAHPNRLRLLGRQRSWKCGSCSYRRRCSEEGQVVSLQPMDPQVSQRALQ